MKDKVEMAYGQQQTNGWTRVDMLIALYESGISSVRAAVASAQQRDQLAESGMHRLKAVRVVHGIAAGLDVEQGEVPQQIARLCEHAQHVIMDGDTSAMEGVVKVLETLRESYVGIREEAVQLEQNGKIPRIDLESTVEVTI